MALLSKQCILMFEYFSNASTAWGDSQIDRERRIRPSSDFHVQVDGRSMDALIYYLHCFLAELHGVESGPMDGDSEKGRNRLADRQTDRQPDKQADEQADRKIFLGISFVYERAMHGGCTDDGHTLD